MAPEPPIHRSTFFVVGDIGHERPTNLLSVDELRWWIVIWFVFGFQFFGNSVEKTCFLTTFDSLGLLLFVIFG